jgi:DNA-binding NarL/FixJ family response regulator
MGIKIGVVDDMPMVYESFSSSLPNFLDDCEVFGSTPDGLEKYLNEVDIIFVDYKMYIPGPDVVRTIKSIRPDVLVVGWSMSLDSERVLEFKDAGADEVISKGSSLAQLAEYIKFLLEK